MVARAMEGVALDEGSRVVELAPGLGLTSAALLGSNPRSWIAVEPDAMAAGHLKRSLAATGREVVSAPLEATGLGEGSASAVVSDGLMSTLSGSDRAPVLAEAARLLRAGGRVVLHEIGPAAGPEGSEAARDLADVGITAIGVDAWRACLEAAGFVVVGSLTGPFALLSSAELMREAGPRTAVAITREVATDPAVRGPALAARRLLERHSSALRSVVVVGEVPLVLGMRRPRR